MFAWAGFTTGGHGLYSDTAMYIYSDVGIWEYRAMFLWLGVGFSAGKADAIMRGNWRLNTLMAEEAAEFWGVERLPFTVCGVN